jgi:hypothetical protein
MRSLPVFVTLLFFSFCSVGAFGPSQWTTRPLHKHAVNALHAEWRTGTGTSTYTRKRYLEQTALVISSTFAAANPVFAKDALEEDKQKLVAGYKRLNYLLDNWEKEVRLPLEFVGCVPRYLPSYLTSFFLLRPLVFVPKDDKLQNQDRVLLG